MAEQRWRRTACAARRYARRLAGRRTVGAPRRHDLADARARSVVCAGRLAYVVDRRQDLAGLRVETGDGAFAIARPDSAGSDGDHRVAAALPAPAIGSVRHWHRVRRAAGLGVDPRDAGFGPVEALVAVPDPKCSGAGREVDRPVAGLERLDDPLGLRVDARDRLVLGVEHPDRALADGDVARRRLRLDERADAIAVDADRGDAAADRRFGGVPGRSRARSRPWPRGRSAPAARIARRCRMSPGGTRRRRARSRGEPERPRRVVDQFGAGGVALVALLGEALARTPDRVAGGRAAARGSSCMCAHSASPSVSRRNGGRPARHS